MKIESTLINITTEIFNTKDVLECKKILTDHILKCGIKEIDKKKIQFNLTQINTHTQLWKYVSNLILRYEGLGINW